jgi:hypothetical protein
MTDLTKTQFAMTRRGLLGSAAGLAALGLAPLRAFAANPPASPVTLNIVDVAGNLALTQPALEAYQKSPSQKRPRRNFRARSKRNKMQAKSISISC